MKKMILFGISGFTTLIVIFGIIIAVTLSQNMKEIRAISIPNYDITTYEDGTYTGQYYYKENQLGASIDLYIEDGKIIDIEINEHITTRGQEAELIINTIKSAQTIDVDAISGATTSSHVIKLAISDALEDN